MLSHLFGNTTPFLTIRFEKSIYRTIYISYKKYLTYLAAVLLTYGPYSKNKYIFLRGCFGFLTLFVYLFSTLKNTLIITNAEVSRFFIHF